MGWLPGPTNRRTRLVRILRMFIRALIVVLAVLNLGVASWWLARPAAPPPAANYASLPAGVATLQLVSAADTGAAGTTDAAPAVPAVADQTDDSSPSVPVPPSLAAPAPAPTPTPTPTPVARCLTLGPFATRADARAALGRAHARIEHAAIREERQDGTDGFRVMMPAVGDRAAAQAIVERISAAGLSDYYMVAQGNTYAIALGKFRNRDGAERRLAELKLKGVSAELLGGGESSSWWIDVRSHMSAASLQSALGAQRQSSLDCAAVR